MIMLGLGELGGVFFGWGRGEEARGGKREGGMGDGDEEGGKGKGENNPDMYILTQ